MNKLLVLGLILSVFIFGMFASADLDKFAKSGDVGLKNITSTVESPFFSVGSGCCKSPGTIFRGSHGTTKAIVLK